MNYLIAKQKRGTNTYFNIITEETESFYALPTDLDNPRDFDNNYQLSDDEWFAIKNFTDTEYSLELLRLPFNSAENSQIGNGELSKIKFFCAVEGNYYYFQRFVSGTLIRKKWLNLTGEPELKIDQPILLIKEVPDAIFAKDLNILYFKKLADIKTIFPHIYNLYKEATDEQTNEFLSSDFIKLGNNYSSDAVKTANRKRIAMVQETLSRLTPQQKSEIHTYIRGYCPDLKFSEDESTFEIVDEETLKMLIYGVEQRFYTTPVGGERRVANSVTKMN